MVFSIFAVHDASHAGPHGRKPVVLPSLLAALAPLPPLLAHALAFCLDFLTKLIRATPRAPTILPAATVAARWLSARAWLLDVHESADLRRLIGRWTEKRDRTGYIQECLVQRQRFDQGGEPPEDRHDSSADFPVVGMVAGKEDGVGAQPPGDNRRHRRVDAEDSGLVRGSGDHSPLPGSTDEYRPPTQLRMAHQLDRREECVHVDVQDRRRAAFERVG